MKRTLAQICQEPFRIFLPAGAALGIVGVSLWMLYYFGAGIPYPSVAHARLMIEGLMASFSLDFSGPDVIAGNLVVVALIDRQPDRVRGNLVLFQLAAVGRLKIKP